MTIVAAWLVVTGLGWMFSVGDLVDSFVDMHLISLKFTNESIEYRAARSNMFRQLSLFISLSLMVLMGVGSALNSLSQSLFTLAMFAIAIVLTVESVRARIFRKNLIHDLDD